METIEIRMLGGFSVGTNKRQIDDAQNRSQKPWLLLAYLICNRDRTVSQAELLRLCWGDEEEKDDPANALRVVLHRTRALLEKLEIGSGKDLLVRSADGFCWNSRLPVWVDAEEFDRLYSAGMAAEDEQRLKCFLKAVELYRGDFLSRNSGGNWSRMTADRLREQYVGMVLAAMEILSKQGRTEEGLELARRALETVPYQETVCRGLMKVLMEQGRAEKAVRFYEQLRRQLLEEFGRMPEEKTKKVYFQALRLYRSPEIPLELHQPDDDKNRGKNGARVCDFNFCRAFHTSVEWLIVQCGLEVYHVLFTISPREDKLFTIRTVDRAADHLVEQLKEELGRGDVITRADECRVLVLIGAKGYENACRTAEKQVELFCRNHPYTAVSIDYGVWKIGENM